MRETEPTPILIRDLQFCLHLALLNEELGLAEAQWRETAGNSAKPLQMCLVLTLGSPAHVLVPILCTHKCKGWTPSLGSSCSPSFYKGTRESSRFKSMSVSKLQLPKGVNLNPSTVNSDQESEELQQASKWTAAVLWEPVPVLLRSQDGADVGMSWAPPAGSESRANPVLEQANRKMLQDLRGASNDSHPSPRITQTQGSSQPNNAPTCPQVTHTANSFIFTRTGMFFLPPQEILTQNTFP